METEENSRNINYSSFLYESNVHFRPSDEVLRQVSATAEFDPPTARKMIEEQMLAIKRILEDFEESFKLHSELDEVLANTIESMKHFKKFYLDHDGSIQCIDIEHGFGSTSRQEVIPVSLHSGRGHFQSSTFSSTPDIGRTHLSTSISRLPNSVAAPDTASGWHFNRQKTSNWSDKISEILDGNDNQRGKTRMADVFQNSTFASTPDVGRSHLFTSISRAPNSIAAPDWASGWPFNRQETSNGADIRIEIPDGNDNQRGKTGMADVCSLATNSTVASSSGCYEFSCDGWTHVPTMAHNIAQLNHQGTSKGAEVTHASFVILKDDDHQALPVMPDDCPDDCPDETKFQTKINNIILGITGQAAVALVSSSSSDLPFLRFFAAATGIGFLGSFLANYILKKPKIARILSKIGAIGAASAVIVALGLYFPKDTNWNLNIVATVAGCLTCAVMVASS